MTTHAEYVAGLPRKRLAAGVLFRTRDAAARELREELGTDRPVGRLIVVDHVQPSNGRPDAMVFVFDGGLLTDADAAGFVFPDGEILSAGLYTLEQARTLSTEMLASRLRAATEAVHEDAVALCEHGTRVG